MCKQGKPNIATSATYNTQPAGCSMIFFQKTSSKLISLWISGSYPVRMWRVFYQEQRTCIGKCILTWQTDKNHVTMEDITPLTSHLITPHSPCTQWRFSGRLSSNVFHSQGWSACNFSLQIPQLIKKSSDENNGNHQDGALSRGASTSQGWKKKEKNRTIKKSRPSGRDDLKKIWDN